MSGVHAGHPGSYRDCQHPACRDYRARYRKRWQYDRAHGHHRLTDAAPAQAHIAALRAAGWSIRSIAGQADLSPTTVSRVARGLQDTIAVTGWAKLRTLVPGQQIAARTYGRAEPFVPRRGTVRRIQALIALGWRHTDLREHTGLNTGILLSQPGEWVTRTTHDTVAEVYDRLCMTPGPSAASRGRAARLGYAPPLAWDDIDHDIEPATTTDPGDADDAIDDAAVERRMAGDKTIALSPAVKGVLRDRWVASGRSIGELECVTGVNGFRDYKRGAA